MQTYHRLSPLSAVPLLNSALAGRYQVERVIGVGGMATVYLARDLKHDRNVALKVLNPELGAVLGVERFLSEIQVTARLQHPNLVPLFDSGEADGLLFYVMPYVPGESLRGRLTRELQLPIDEAIRITTAAAAAVDYAHRHDVIHRDLKPENILLHEGQPLVADFGIALALSSSGGTRLTQAGMSLGTPQYMSPEQATADRVIDARTDVYSLGAIAYEMLTGDAPHVGNSAQAIITRVLTERPRSIRSTRPTVSGDVEAVVMRALEKIPADRWPTVRDFADALSAASRASAETGRETTVAGSGRGEAVREPQPGRGRRRHIATWIGGVAIAAIAIVLYVVGRPKSGETTLPGEPSIAVLPFVNMSSDPANEYLSDGMTEELLHLLAQVPGIHVAARTSSFFYKGKNLPVDSIGRAMRVHTLLEGSVRQSGNRVRITAQLIDTQTGYHLWSDSFERPVEDVFIVQDSIGRAIVRLLTPRLARGTQAPATPERREPRDPEAHIAAMKGWRAFRANTREAYVAAADHFQEAIRRDPEYGYAIAGLATVRHWQAYLRHLPVEAAYAESRALANRALVLDSSLVDGWLVLGRLAEVVDRDYPLALSYFARAVAVAPSDSRPYQRQAVLLARLDRTDEALAAARRGVELDPVSPGAHAALGQLYAALDRHKEAESAYREALTLDPGHPLLLGNLALSLTKQKRYGEVEPVILEARRKAPKDVTFIGQHAFIASQTGKTREAKALLDTAEALGLSRVELAVTWSSLGDTARALDLLERAVRERDDGVSYLLDTTVFTDLRRLPRYERLLAEVRRSERASGDQ